MAGTISYTEHTQLYQAVEDAERLCMAKLDELVPKLRDRAIFSPRIFPDLNRGVLPKGMDEYASIVIFDTVHGRCARSYWERYVKYYMPLVRHCISMERIDVLDTLDLAWNRDNFDALIDGDRYNLDLLADDNLIVQQFEMRCQLKDAFFAYLRVYHSYLRAVEKHRRDNDDVETNSNNKRPRDKKPESFSRILGSRLKKMF